MKKIFKYLIPALLAVTLTSGLLAQDHVIGTDQNPRTKSRQTAHNFGYVEKSTVNGIRTPYAWSMSMDSINITSSSINSGDSITMLIGDIPAVIYQVLLEPTVGTPYTSGSLDTVIVYSVIDDTSRASFYFSDTTFTSVTPFVTSQYVSTQADSDSCNIYIKLPESKWSLGTHSFILYYWYLSKQ